MLQTFLSSLWGLSLEMSPYILFGFFVAGILKVFLPREKVVRHLSGKGLMPVLKAALFGIPLPLCSCSVIPVAAHLRKSGGSKASVISFLSSTPSTGVDSIIATYAMVGPVIAIFRPIMALLSGLLAGSLSDSSSIQMTSEPEVKTKAVKGLRARLKAALDYGGYDLMRDTGKWVVLGIFLGALVTTFFPPELAQKWLSGGMTSYLIMLVAGLPLYVCATGSIPLAAAFLAVGASPGAALVFLTAGPATNTATMGFVAGVLGKRTFLAYFFSISLVSLSGGVLLDYYFADSMQSMGHHHHDTTNLWYWFQTLCTIVFLGLLFRVYITDFLKRSPAVAVDISYNRSYKIPAISCGGCILNIERALKPLSQTGDYRIDLESKTLYINGTISDKELRQKLAEAGYPPLT